MLQRLIKNLIYQDLEVIGQSADHKYIMCFYSRGHCILAFDQHAVHERIKFEELVKKLVDENGEINIKNLKVPIKVNLNLVSRERFANLAGKGTKALDNHLHLIRSKSGLTLDLPIMTRKYSQQFDTILIKSLPSIMDLQEVVIRPDIIAIIIDNIHESCDLIDSSMSNRLYEYIQTRACRSSLKFGQQLTRNDCRTLMTQLLKCSVPFFCAHQRPNVSIIPLLDILDKESDIELEQ